MNGEPRQVSHSGSMSVTIPEIIATIRRSGTPRATSSRRERSLAWPVLADPASLYLKPGDVMEAEIEGIGVLRNPVISWQEGHGEPAPPRVSW